MKKHKDHKWISKEARIITERYDDKIASGFKTKHLGEKDDYMSAITRQISEQHARIKGALRAEIIRHINLEFNTNIGLDDLFFKYKDKNVELLKGTGRGGYGNRHRETLHKMPADIFRETIAECLAIIPGGLQYFREISERTPYIFD